jgi:hypothetical protein
LSSPVEGEERNASGLVKGGIARQSGLDHRKLLLSLFFHHDLFKESLPTFLLAD